MSHLRAVIFDVDGVLVLSEPLSIQSAIALFAEKGYQVTPDEFRPFIGTGEAGLIGGVAERRGIPLDPARDKAHMFEIYRKAIRGRLQPIAGLSAFLDDCRQRGLRLGIASGADRARVDANLSEIGLAPSSFDAVIDGAQRRRKPAPDIFIDAARSLDVPSTDCLVVEDAVTGVAAAKAAGCRCLAVMTSFGAAELAQADWIAADLAHVPRETLEW